MKVKSAEIYQKDWIVDEVRQLGGGIKPDTADYTLTKDSGGAPAGGGVVWKLFGLPEGPAAQGATARLVYVAAKGKDIAEALTFVLDKPRVVRGLLLFDPLIDVLPSVMVSRLHAVRCPGIIVVSHTSAPESSGIARETVHGPFSRMPNISFRVVDSEGISDIERWQREVEQMPHRYSMKSRNRKAN